jgi:hypothetical protein
MIESPEAILSWVTGYLEVEDDPRLARVVEECDLRIIETYGSRFEELLLVAPEYAAYEATSTIAVLTVPPDLYREANAQRSRLGGAIWEGLSGKMDEFFIRAGPERVWSNQGTSFNRSDAPHVWKGMRFRSYSEQAIAEALDRACIDFQPNCMMRTGSNPDDRNNVEPDFVIHAFGRTGVLEVDGRPWHPPEFTADQHARDRRLRAKGWIVERFDAEECRKLPDDVVAQFLCVLRAAPSVAPRRAIR